MHFASMSAQLCLNRLSLPSSTLALVLPEFVVYAWVSEALAVGRVVEYAEIWPN